MLSNVRGTPPAMRSDTLSVVAVTVYKAAPANNTAMPPGRSLASREAISEIPARATQMQHRQTQKQCPALQIEFEDCIHATNVATHYDSFHDNRYEQGRADQKEDKAFDVGHVGTQDEYASPNHQRQGNPANLHITISEIKQAMIKAAIPV